MENRWPWSLGAPTVQVTNLIKNPQSTLIDLSRRPSDESIKRFILIWSFGIPDVQMMNCGRITKGNLSIFSVGTPCVQVMNLLKSCKNKGIDLQPWSSKRSNDEFD